MWTTPRTPSSRRLAALTVVLALPLVGVAACGGGDDGKKQDQAGTTAGSPSQKTSTKKPEASTSESPSPSDSEKSTDKPEGHKTQQGPSRSRRTVPAEKSDKANSTRSYLVYLAVMDAMTASGGEKTSQLKKVATGIALRAATDQAKAYRKRNLHTAGRTRVRWARTVDLTGAKATYGPVTVRACYDAAKPVDAKGRSALREGAPTRWLEEMQMRPEGGVWKASFAKTTDANC